MSGSARRRGLRKRTRRRRLPVGPFWRAPPGSALQGEGLTLAEAGPSSGVCLQPAPDKIAAGSAKLGAEEPKLCLELLPSDPLLLIFSFLDYRDLVRCSCVSRHLNHLSNHDILWRSHCKRYWLLSEADKTKRKKSWKSLFRDTYIDLGRYIHHYATLKKAWTDLEVYLEEKCPRMITSLNEGLEEWELNAMEAQIGYKLPNDFRCSLRIHNGQRLVDPGLIGSVAFLNHYRSETLLDLHMAVGLFQNKKFLKQSLPLTLCIHTGLGQHMLLESIEDVNKFEIFYLCPEQVDQNPLAIEMFLTAASYSEWFTFYVHKVVTGEYPIIRNQIFRYVHDKGCVTTNGNITVSVSTSFLPEFRSIHPPCYFFTYRIRTEMSKDALPEKVCRLHSLHLKITSDEGEIDIFDGPEFMEDIPILSPGQFFEYASYTPLFNTSGYMEGHFTFHSIHYPGMMFNVDIPRFHMVCPTFKVSTNSMEMNLDKCSDIE